MLTILQRVSQAHVEIEGRITGRIQQGLLILCGFEAEDRLEHLEKMISKCLNYRIFTDEQGKMNLSLKDIQGSMLLVPQFTLMADTQTGLRPSFSKAADAKLGRTLFEALCLRAAQQYPEKIQQGCFGADMQVHLCNDGPATFILKF